MRDILARSSSVTADEYVDADFAEYVKSHEKGGAEAKKHGRQGKHAQAHRRDIKSDYPDSVESGIELAANSAGKHVQGTEHNVRDKKDRRKSTRQTDTYESDSGAVDELELSDDENDDSFDAVLRSSSHRARAGSRAAEKNTRKTGGERREKGGSKGTEERLIKELYKLQDQLRELQGGGSDDSDNDSATDGGQRMKRAQQKSEKGSRAHSSLKGERDSVLGSKKKVKAMVDPDKKLAGARGSRYCMCACACACMCVYMYARMCMCMGIHTRTQAYTHCMHACMHACIHNHT